MSNLDMSELDEPTLSEHQLDTFRQAQRLVAGHSIDAPDCRILLAMLGIPENAV
ncbi:hypothetical protein [Antrihabitans sp. YC2-6]|uniref:hypothetical protein n=1 Tax=Antrihabitans sp. YC2-6 TaxID=2799498 RepID=UPI0018F56B6F|nr:hypothetical protein [Antrihabitans sp. YC2-6]MBJ8344305.1 hypothetical protein [Antrihabitans sp. YC2-6]